MIITRTPLRISIGGGGTDLPSYYEKFGGFVISAAIDNLRVPVTCQETFMPESPPAITNLLSWISSLINNMAGLPIGVML